LVEKERKVWTMAWRTFDNSSTHSTHPMERGLASKNGTTKRTTNTRLHSSRPNQ
jgi:hypothetical protein